MINRVFLRIVWREYLVYALIFTLLSCMWLYRFGPPGLVYAFWLKLIGGLAISTYLYIWRRKCLYVFYNLGYGRRHVLALFLLSDLLVSFAIYIPFLFIRPYFPPS